MSGSVQMFGCLSVLLASSLLCGVTYHSKNGIVYTEDGEVRSVYPVSNRIVIPDEIDGVRLTSIGDFAMARQSMATDYIPSASRPGHGQTYGSIDFMTVNGYGAGASGGASLEFPKGLTAIGKFAFYGCQVGWEDFPEGLVWIGESAFANTSRWGKLTFPKSLRVIGAQAFKGLRDLSEISLNEGLEVIGSSAFEGCGQVTFLTIPASVKTIETNAFCRDWDRRDVPINVRLIGSPEIICKQGTELNILAEGAPPKTFMPELQEDVRTICYTREHASEWKALLATVPSITDGGIFGEYVFQGADSLTPYQKNVLKDFLIRQYPQAKIVVLQGGAEAIGDSIELGIFPKGILQNDTVTLMFHKPSLTFDTYDFKNGFVFLNISPQEGTSDTAVFPVPSERVTLWATNSLDVPMKKIPIRNVTGEVLPGIYGFIEIEADISAYHFIKVVIGELDTVSYEISEDGGIDVNKPVLPPSPSYPNQSM